MAYTSTPASRVVLCAGVPLDKSYQHTIHFGSRSAQLDYFSGKAVSIVENYTYIRKERALRMDWEDMGGADNPDANYLYYENAEGFRYFAFITDTVFVNASLVEVHFEIDVLQTYLLDTKLNPCYVEREHSVTDGLFENTLDEGLETGELIAAKTEDFDLGAWCIMIMSTINPADTTDNPAPALPYMYNNVFSGIKLWAVPAADWVNWSKQMETLDENGQTDNIIAMWMYPKNLITLPDGAAWTDELALPVEGSVSDESEDRTEVVAGNFSKLQGYTPRNKKLFCYPYNFLYLTNNQGGATEYKYEKFIDKNGEHCGAYEFTLSGALSPEGGVHITPKNYMGQEYAFEHGLQLGNFPMCAWNSDTYKLWLAQNQNQRALDYIGAGVKIVAGGVVTAAGAAGAMATGGLTLAAVGGGVSTMASGFSQIAQLSAQKKDMQVQPIQAKGNFSASVNMCNDKQCFTLSYKTITAEYAAVIDDFFDMYGYKCQRVKVPNISSRPAWNYVKTIGSHVSANGAHPPHDALKKIDAIFDNGVTFWKNPEKLGDYSQTNTP